MKSLLSVSVRVFLEEIRIWIGGLSTPDVSPQREWAALNPALYPRAWIEQKGRGRLNPSSA